MTQGLTASIVVNAGNTADLPRTLESVKFANEVLVEEVSQSGQPRGVIRNETIARARHPFVLILGDGEMVSPALQAELAAITALATSSDAPAAYRVPRRGTYLGRVVRCRGWQGEGDLRLLDRRHASVRVDDQGRVAVGADVKVGDLRGEIHWNGTMSLTSLLRDLARKSSDAEGNVPPLVHLVTSPMKELWSSFWRGGGFQGGGAGFLLATMDSLEVLVRLSRRWEAANRRGR